MKAVSAGLPTDDERWAFEVKFDGYRTVAHVDGGRLRLQSLRLPDVTARYPELAGLPEAVNAGSAVLDGEVVAFDEAGRPSFGALQQHESPVTYVVFDVLELNGVDTTGLPYEDRRRLLDKLVEPGPRWRVDEWTVGGGAGLLAVTEALGLEGVMAKRLGSRYTPGKRSPAWRKIKHRRRQELVVGGFTQGTGNREHTFGALLVGYHDDTSGDRLRFAGGVGTGFDQRLLAGLTATLRSLASDTCPFAEPPTAVGRRIGWRTVARTSTWVRPELVCEVAFGEWTADGILRHPSFLGLRDDKDPRDVVREP